MKYCMMQILRYIFGLHNMIFLENCGKQPYKPCILFFIVVYFLISTSVTPSYILSYDMTPACHQILVQCISLLTQVIISKINK
jgi:hypothetical protein